MDSNYDSNICNVFVSLPAKLLDDNVFGSWDDCFDLQVWERKSATSGESLVVVRIFA